MINLPLRYICSSKKAIKAVLSFKQVLLPIFNWVFCAFYESLLILMFSTHFLLEAINRTNIQACLKDSSNVNMKLLPRALSPEPRLPDPQALFDFCFVKDGMSKLGRLYVSPV